MLADETALSSINNSNTVMDYEEILEFYFVIPTKVGIQY